MVEHIKLPPLWDKDYLAKVDSILRSKLKDFEGADEKVFMYSMLALTGGAVNPAHALKVFREDRSKDD